MYGSTDNIYEGENMRMKLKINIEKLKQALAENLYTQASFAHTAGISEPYFSKITREKDQPCISPTMAQRIMDTLGKEYNSDDLFTPSS